MSSKGELQCYCNSTDTPITFHRDVMGGGQWVGEAVTRDTTSLVVLMADARWRRGWERRLSPEDTVRGRDCAGNFSNSKYPLIIAGQKLERTDEQN